MASMITSVTLDTKAKKALLNGGLWFGRGDIIGRRPNLPGIAVVYDKQKNPLGTAFLSPGSAYFLRLFSRRIEKADRSFWRERMLKAYKRRAQLFDVTDAFRVVYGEADGMPSVIVDKYNDIWSFQITSAGAETIRNDIISIIEEEFSPASIIEKDDIAIREKDGLARCERVVFGTKTKALVKEADQVFEVGVLSGQKTGAYLDYRKIRLMAKEVARGKCLDAFSYQGWFSCQIAGGATEVIGVDSSATATAAARENAERNGHKNCEFIKSDVFDYLERSGGKFDFVHLDPPSFSKGGGSVRQAMQGYKKLIALAVPRLKKDGTMIVSSCSHAVTERLLEEAISAAMSKAGRRCKVLFRAMQDADHPVVRGHSESLYLKAIAIRCG
jgi:23S rRNA (cytosine1962-C5)-methyltransferase